MSQIDSKWLALMFGCGLSQMSSVYVDTKKLTIERGEDERRHPENVSAPCRCW